MAQPYPRDLPRLFQRAQAALISEPKRTITGGWAKDPFRGRKYALAEFDFDGEPWVVTTGTQSSAYARLIDATASAMAHLERRCAVAILKSPREPSAPIPTPRYVDRFRTASWNGLGILLHTPELDFEWNQTGVVPNSLIAEVARSVGRELIAAADATWASITKSRDAEALVRPLVSAATKQHYSEEIPAGRFGSFWRYAQADGAWQTGMAGTLALEVKVNEDLEAPFGQLVDDLGQYDHALQVRFITNERTRRALGESSALDKVSGRFEEMLPVRKVYLRFCAVCRGPVHHDGLAYPHLVCVKCDERATSPSGQEANPGGDDGPNPVYIDGAKCWRRYRFGGHLTMRDPDNLPSLDAFYAKHKGH
ncbi:MAG: hypothetical protein AB7S68_41760 [Polyangiaceae bacterium]